MAPRLPPETCSRIKGYLLETELSAADIAVNVGVSKRTIERVRLSYELFGKPYPDPVAVRGKHRALSYEHGCWLVSYLDDQPSAYLDELVLALYDEFELEVHKTTVYRYLSGCGWSRKVAKQVAAQRNATLRAVWASRAARWSMEDLCFVDESAANEKTGARKRGWSPKGLSCQVLRTLKRSERYSILPALTVNGYLPEPLVIQGGVHQEVFARWIVESVLPYLRPGMKIVMDNASIHHNLGIDELLASQGVCIEYLPPYSPDWNPIEMTFHTLKKWLLSNWGQMQWYIDFSDFILAGLEASVDTDCRGYFRHCGYS